MSLSDPASFATLHEWHRAPSRCRRSLTLCLRFLLPFNRALASVKATLGPAFSAGAPAGDVEMEVEPVAEAGLPAEAKARVAETNKRCACIPTVDLASTRWY